MRDLPDAQRRSGLVTSFLEILTPHPAIVASGVLLFGSGPTMMTRKSESGTWVAVHDSPAMLDINAPSAAEGERRLMIAVLVHALRSLFRDAERPGRGAIRRLRQDLRWLTSPDQTDVFAFERICEAIGIDAHRVRQHVLDELGAVTQLLNAPPRRQRRSRLPVASPDFSVAEPVRAAG
jgi:hypothetical protein